MSGIEGPEVCQTVGELQARLHLAAGGGEAPLAILYDWGADVKFGVLVRGMHVCDSGCDPDACVLRGHVVLDIDPTPDDALGTGCPDSEGDLMNRTEAISAMQNFVESVDCDRSMSGVAMNSHHLPEVRGGDVRFYAAEAIPPGWFGPDGRISDFAADAAAQRECESARHPDWEAGR